MRTSKHLILGSLLVLTANVLAAQQVGGLVVEYIPAFQENPQKAQSWRAKMNPDLQAMIRDFQIFEAPGNSGMNELRILKIQYNSQIRGTIDASASETVDNVARLPGIKNPSQRIVAIKVSGQEARRISFESDRNDGRLGAEFLIIQDSKRQTLYQIQVIFSKKPNVNPFSTPSLSEQQMIANVILDSVKIERP